MSAEWMLLPGRSATFLPEPCSSSANSRNSTWKFSSLASVRRSASSLALETIRRGFCIAALAAFGGFAEGGITYLQAELVNGATSSITGGHVYKDVQA